MFVVVLIGLVPVVWLAFLASYHALTHLGLFAKAGLNDAAVYGGYGTCAVTLYVLTAWQTSLHQWDLWLAMFLVAVPTLALFILPLSLLLTRGTRGNFLPQVAVVSLLPALAQLAWRASTSTRSWDPRWLTDFYMAAGFLEICGLSFTAGAMYYRKPQPRGQGS